MEAVWHSTDLKFYHIILIGCCHPWSGIPKILWNNVLPISLEIVSYVLDILHRARNQWKLQISFFIFVGCCQTYLGMLRKLPNKTLPLYLAWDECLSYFSTCSQTHMQATNRSYHFSWVLSGMLQCAKSAANNKLPKFVYRVIDWLGSLHVVRHTRKLWIDPITLVACGQVCSGVQRVLWNAKPPIFFFIFYFFFNWDSLHARLNSH